MTLANPARLALHILRAVLPHGVEADATRVRFSGANTEYDLETAAGILDQYSKPIVCRASELDGALVLEISAPAGLVENVLDNLIIDDLHERAAQTGNDRVLIVGRNGSSLVTTVENFVALERDYQIGINHFVRTDSPGSHQAAWNVIRAISYFPSASHTTVHEG